MSAKSSAHSACALIKISIVGGLETRNLQEGLDKGQTIDEKCNPATPLWFYTMAPGPGWLIGSYQ